MGCKKFIIKKIENFFCTIVNGIPQPNKHRTNRPNPNQQPTNSQLPAPNLVCDKKIMASLTFTVVARKSRKPRRQSNTTQTKGKVSSAWRRRTTRPHQPRKPRKTFCKVCFDAGKEEKCYTSHFVKDRPGPNGKIVCPTLLSTECRYCHEKGHFKSHCPVLAERKSQPKRAPRQEHGSWLSAEQLAQVEAQATVAKVTKAHQKAHSKPKAVATRGAFECLGSDSEEEEMTYERPSIARPRSPQGYWGGKPVEQSRPVISYENVEKLDADPVLAEEKQPEPSYDLSLQCDEEFRSTKATRTVEVIMAEIKETQEELSIQENSDSWADACDTDDLEEKLEELEEELAAAKEAEEKKAHSELKEQKDQFGRPCADDSAW